LRPGRLGEQLSERCKGDHSHIATLKIHAVFGGLRRCSLLISTPFGSDPGIMRLMHSKQESAAPGSCHSNTEPQRLRSRQSGPCVVCKFPTPSKFQVLTMSRAPALLYEVVDSKFQVPSSGDCVDPSVPVLDSLIKQRHCAQTHTRLASPLSSHRRGH